jgi:hypothetical protein
MEPYLLFVTLVLGANAPHTYQVEFSSKDMCDKASAELQVGYDRLSGSVIVTTVCAKMTTENVPAIPLN